MPLGIEVFGAVGIEGAGGSVRLLFFGGVLLGGGDYFLLFEGVAADAEDHEPNAQGATFIEALVEDLTRFVVAVGREWVIDNAEAIEDAHDKEDGSKSEDEA